MDDLGDKCDLFLDCNSTYENMDDWLLHGVIPNWRIIVDPQQR